jgi:hypothetical protein
MNMQILRLLAEHEGSFLLYEPSAPIGTLKKEFVSLRAKDGSDLHVPVSLDDFNAFLNKHFITTNGRSPDAQQRIRYHLTDSGRAAGLKA